MKYYITLTLILFLFNVTAESNEIEPKSVIDQRVEINAGQIKYYDFSLEQGEKVTINISVAGSYENKAEIMLLNIANYQRYISNRPFFPIRDSLSIVDRSATFQLSTPKTDIYYLIIDNSKARVTPTSFRTQISVES